MKKIIAFDLDDTLCYRPKDVEHLGKDKYNFCKPIEQMVGLCNKLYDQGHSIVIYTARGMMTFNGDVKKIYENLYDKTISDLNSWGVKYNQLVMGKIHYDYLIDDKALDLEFAKNNLLNLIKDK